MDDAKIFGIRAARACGRQIVRLLVGSDAVSLFCVVQGAGSVVRTVRATRD